MSTVRANWRTNGPSHTNTRPQVSLVRPDQHAEAGQVGEVALPLAPLDEVVDLGVGRQVLGRVDPCRVAIVAEVEPPPAASRPLRAAAPYVVIISMLVYSTGAKSKPIKYT